jgi:alpha-L-fucosidase
VRRDCVGELADAVRAKGLRYGLYYSGGLDWTFGGLPIDSFPALIRAIPQSAEYAAYADGHWRELIERYAPDVLWNDIAYPHLANGPRLIADYYNEHPDGVVNDRFDVLGVRAGTAHADFVTPEYAALDHIEARMWESCRGIGHSFGYNAWETDADHASVDELVALLADIVAKGGNLLLNVGPTARGEIPAPQANRLTGIGWWLRDNGEAIFGTRPWVCAEGTVRSGSGMLPVRYTSRAETVYVVVCGRAEEATLHLGIRPAPGGEVRLLGHRDALSWEGTAAGCRVLLPQRPAPGPGLALALSPVTPPL